MMIRNNEIHNKSASLKSYKQKSRFAGGSITSTTTQRLRNKDPAYIPVLECKEHQHPTEFLFTCTMKHDCSSYDVEFFGRKTGRRGDSLFNCEYKEKRAVKPWVENAIYDKGVYLHRCIDSFNEMQGMDWRLLRLLTLSPFYISSYKGSCQYLGQCSYSGLVVAPSATDNTRENTLERGCWVNIIHMRYMMYHLFFLVKLYHLI